MQRDFESNLTKRVSFVLTTKNRGPYLKKALKNTKELIGTDDELIIIDGNSTDETQDIIRENSDYIDIFLSEDDEGQGHAYNKGLLLSKGKYVCYITDDDIYYSKAVEQAVEIMEKHPDIDVLIPGGMKEKNGKEWFVYMREGSDFGRNVESLYTNNWCGLGFFIRTSSITKAGLSDPYCVAHDNSYIAQCIDRGLNVRFARINMFYHRIYEHSGTVARFKSWEEDYLGIIKKYCSQTFYFKYRWLVFKNKHKWLKYFKLIKIPVRVITILFQEGPSILFKKITKRVFYWRDNSIHGQEDEKELNDMSFIVWDGTIN